MAHSDVVRSVEWAVLSAQLPGQEAVPVGILLVDLIPNQLFVRLRPDLIGTDEEVAAFWHELSHELLKRSEASADDYRKPNQELMFGDLRQAFL